MVNTSDELHISEGNDMINLFLYSNSLAIVKELLTFIKNTTPVNVSFILDRHADFDVLVANCSNLVQVRERSKQSPSAIISVIQFRIGHVRLC